MTTVAHRLRNSAALAKALKYFGRAHIWTYQHTNGRIGAKLLWLPAALVTTTGRKTGAERTTATLCLTDGDRVVLPASFGGRDANPAWYLNAKADPRVRVRFRNQVRDMTARDASDDERQRYWPELVKMYPPYRNYQAATDRLIPLVVCEPAGSGPEDG